MNIVVAYDERGAIGKNNELLWNFGDLKADKERFLGLTLYHTVAMGRKTLESIGGPLKNRRTIVLSRSLKVTSGFEVARSLEEVADMTTEDGPVYLIGGEQIYREALSKKLVHTIFATEVMVTFSEADAFFPRDELSDGWYEEDRISYAADNDNKYDCDFVTYEHR